MFHSATEKGGVKASICPEEETCGSIGSDLDAMIKNIKQAKKAREQQETGKKEGNNKKGSHLAGLKLRPSS